MNFFDIVSASSSMLIRSMSLSPDFDIFFDPSRRFITRIAGPSVTGSVSGKKSTP